MITRQSPKLTPDRRYHELMRLWQLHVSASEPDCEQLRQLHQALSNEEAQLCTIRLDRCLENLQQRISDALAIGMRLQLPLWTTIEHNEAIRSWLEELGA
jgi:hypothetical protein